eukprot:4504353-Heterocapsa_arctica.AAC.1
MEGLGGLRQDDRKEADRQEGRDRSQVRPGRQQEGNWIEWVEGRVSFCLGVSENIDPPWRWNSEGQGGIRRFKPPGPNCCWEVG